MGWFRKKVVEPLVDSGPKLPRGIEKVDIGYRVKGRFSVHKTLEKAMKQLEGMKDAN